MTTLHPRIKQITEAIIERSLPNRTAYLAQIEAATSRTPQRRSLACANFAHGFAAAEAMDKLKLKAAPTPNIAIVSSYNDMLSAHQPLEQFPAIIKQAAREVGATAQFAGGVPAMCDGVTQGRAGMELSLFSREVIAMSTAIALSHDMFDGALCLGVCDKIIPGLLIGALHFGHLPVVFVPAGPMSSGLSNTDKSKIRQQFAEGKIGRDALLEAEAKAYHGAGTCTFYGTANSNQLLMEMMGLHLAGAAFVSPNTPLRHALTAQAAKQVSQITALGDDYRPIGRIVDEKAIVNAMVGLLASGGSTNHTMHLVAIAKAAGITINWTDFSELSAITPLIARIYPNGPADINHFHAAGGMGFMIAQLLQAGLLHRDVLTVQGTGLEAYQTEPWLDQAQLKWRAAPQQSLDAQVLTTADNPFSIDGGLKLLEGNLGRAVIKVSAVKPEHRFICAPARVFTSQAAVIEAFEAGQLDNDGVVVVMGQGAAACGMPELHKLIPVLGILQDRGFKVALVTDGRMSGASGKVPAAIHVSPEAVLGGALAYVRDGDLITVDAEHGLLHAEVANLSERTPQTIDLSCHQTGTGRELFRIFRTHTSSAEQGAALF